MALRPQSLLLRMVCEQLDGRVQKAQAKKRKQVGGLRNRYDSVHGAHCYGQNKGGIQPTFRQK
jgi:hypothetical protein